MGRLNTLSPALALLLTADRTAASAAAHPSVEGLVKCVRPLVHLDYLISTMSPGFQLWSKNGSSGP